MSVIGPLEERVLDVLWRTGEGTVREVLAHLGTDHAYTTILTVLDRLHGKALVRRRKEQGSWVYAAAASPGEQVGREVARLLIEARGGDGLLVGFLDEAESLDPAVLDQLEDLLRRRRAQQR